jgi:hypothetical protein
MLKQNAVVRDGILRGRYAAPQDDVVPFVARRIAAWLTEPSVNHDDTTQLRGGSTGSSLPDSQAMKGGCIVALPMFGPDLSRVAP